MAKIKHLVAGEFQRLTKYNLFTASFFVALIWIGLGIFLDPEEFRMFLPFVFLMEASAMTALLVGAQMYYEKKEHTISSMLISPISSSDYIISKILTNIINLIIIFGVIFLSMYFIKDMTFNYLILLIAVFLVTAFYVFVGILLSYISKDFTALLLNYMVIMIVFILPSIAVMIGLLPVEWKDYLFWFPSDVTIRLFMASTEASVDWVQYALDSAYILVLGFIFFRFLILPRFKDYATANLGV
jgi:fluoroquinolone transport system permease protein